MIVFPAALGIDVV